MLGESKQTARGRKLHVVDLGQHLALALDARPIHKLQRPPQKGPAIFDEPALPLLKTTNVLTGVQPGQVQRRVQHIPYQVPLILMLVCGLRTQIHELRTCALRHLRRRLVRIGH